MLTIADSRMVLVISKHSDFDAAHTLCQKTNKKSKKCNDHLSIDRRIASGFLQSAAMNFLTLLGIHVRHDTVLESVVFFSSVYQSDPIESSQIILHCMLICVPSVSLKPGKLTLYKHPQQTGNIAFRDAKFLFTMKAFQ